MAEVTDTNKLIDPINIKTLIEFLEYEEALTKDRETATRITLLLKQLKIWN
jgi:hypothetical protein